MSDHEWLLHPLEHRYETVFATLEDKCSPFAIAAR